MTRETILIYGSQLSIKYIQRDGERVEEVGVAVVGVEERKGWLSKLPFLSHYVSKVAFIHPVDIRQDKAAYKHLRRTYDTLRKSIKAAIKNLEKGNFGIDALEAAIRVAMEKVPHREKYSIVKIKLS